MYTGVISTLAVCLVAFVAVIIALLAKKKKVA